MLHMTKFIIEHKETLGKAIYPALKDVNHPINLGNEFFCIKELILIFLWFENDAGLCREINIKQIMKKKKNLLLLHRCCHCC